MGHGAEEKSHTKQMQVLSSVPPNHTQTPSSLDPGLTQQHEGHEEISDFIDLLLFIDISLPFPYF